MKKYLSILLALALMAGLLAGCGSSTDASASAQAAPEVQEPEASSAEEAEAPQEPEASEPEPEASVQEPAAEEASVQEPEEPQEPEEEPFVYELPLTEGGETLTMFAITNSNVTDNIGSLQDHQIYQAAVEMTGVYVEIDAVMMETSNDQFALVIASGDWPDMVRSANYPSGLTSAYEEEIVLDLADYMEFAPNYSAILDQNPKVAKDVKTDNGSILEMYFLNSYNGEFSVPLLEGPVIREDLLSALGLQVPDTVDALHDTLSAFKAEYDLADPLYVGNNAFAASGFLMGAFDASAELYQVDGQVKYGPAQEGFRKYLETMTKWYSEGILNSDFYSYDDNPMSPVTESKKRDGDIGVFNAPASNLAAYCSDTVNYVGMPILGNDQGENHFISTIVVDTGKGMTITTTCSNIELAVRWCDFWYSEPGRLLSNYGIEGVTFEYDEQGQPHWTDMLLNNAGGLSVGIARQCFVLLTQQPGVCPKEIEVSLLNENSIAAVETWGQVGDGAYAMPNVSLTADESSRAAQILSDLNTLNQETWNRILMGQQSMDTWDQYLADIESMGASEYAAIYQAAVDRYNSR